MGGRFAPGQALVRLMKKFTRCEPQLWGPSIVGFALRNGDISIYLPSGFESAAMRQRHPQRAISAGG